MDYPKALGRQPDFVVGKPEDPYLLRWWVIPRNKRFNVYLHKFLRSDDDVQADDPIPRIRPELTPSEAMAVEACLVLGDFTQRDLLLGVAKRLRRRMRKAGWPTPDRDADHLENIDPQRGPNPAKLQPMRLPPEKPSAWALALIEAELGWSDSTGVVAGVRQTGPTAPADNLVVAKGGV